MNLAWMDRFLTSALGCVVIFLAATGVVVGERLPDDTKAVLEAADEAREQGRYEEAQERLDAARKEIGDHAAILWRRAWTLSDMGEQKEGDARETLFEEAWQKAQQAVDADSENARAHMVAAIAAGRKALISGTRRQVELSRKVKEHADRAIALDSQLAPAYHARGVWHREVAGLGRVTRLIVRAVYGGLPEASLEEALDDLRKSIELDDQIPDRVELGAVYWAMNEREKAREQWRKALEMPRVLSLDEVHQRRAKQKLANAGD